MPDSHLDPDGNLPLTPEVRRLLGWEAGQAVHLRVEGDTLMVGPATASGSVKEEALRLAASMRDLTLGALQHAREAVQPSTAAPEDREDPEEPKPASPKPAASSGVAPAGVTGAFAGISPHIAASAYLAPGSTVIGDVVLGEEVSIWPGVSIRGDVAAVRVGARTNVQDGAVLHVSPQTPCVVGAGVTIGHQATVHACTIGDDTLIGIQAVVLDGARIGRHCIIAAGAVVPPGMEIPDGKMVMGVPGKVLRDLTPQEIERVHWNADSYVSLKNQYQNPKAVPAVPTPGASIPGLRPAPPERGSLPRYECHRAAGAIRIDGALDDPGWQGIQPLSALIHSNGTGSPEQPTELRACWDDACLYLSFSCKDADIWGNFEKRDDPLYDEEVVEAFLCPTGDLRHYFEIEISPLNTLFDARVFNPDGDRATMLLDRTWDARGLRSAVRVSGILNDRTARDIGWIVEIAIPFRDLGLDGPPPAGTVWRANFFRIERGEVTEFTAWSPTYREPADFHVPPCFGELVFVEEEGL